MSSSSSSLEDSEKEEEDVEKVNVVRDNDVAGDEEKEE